MIVSCRQCCDHTPQFSPVQFSLFNSSQRKSQWKASLKRWVLSPARNWPHVSTNIWKLTYSPSHFETTAHLWHLWFICAIYKFTHLLTLYAKCFIVLLLQIIPCLMPVAIKAFQAHGGKLQCVCSIRKQFLYSQVRNSPAFELYQLQWPWLTPDPDFKVTAFVAIRYLKNGAR